MQYFLRNKALIIIIILSIIFVPLALSKEAQGENEAIVIAMGVDKQDEYEVSLQVLVPTPDTQFNQKVNIVYAKGKDITEAINKIEVRLGKPIGLVHCHTIVFGDSVCQDNVISIIDYVSRTRVNTNNISLIHTESTALEFLSDSGDLNNSLHFVLNDNNFNKNSIYGTFSSLGKFYDSYFSDSSCYIMASIGIKSVEDVGGLGPEYDISGDQSVASDSGGSGDKSDKKVTNNEGKSVIFKHGKKVRLIDMYETAAINWVNDIAVSGTIEVGHVDDELYQDATVSLTVRKKKNKKQVYFVDGRPVLKVKIDIVANVEEIDNDSLYLKQIASSQKMITPALEDKIKNKIGSYIATALSIARETDCDLFDIARDLKKYHYNEYRDFVYKYSVDELIPMLDVEYEVNIVERL